MRLFTALVFIMMIHSVFGRVEFISLYYLPPEVQPTTSSQKELDDLLKLLNTKDVQVIEINAYSALNTDDRHCEVLSRRRILHILEYLEIKGEPITKNAYGKKRIELNFEPRSWDRVDIYYNIEDIEIDAVEVVTPPDTLKKDPPVKSDVIQKKIPKRDVIQEDTPIVIPIKFIGGKTQIKPESYKYLKHLLKTLETHQELNAHIRGHVCCKNRKLMSKKRAKRVYKYLVDGGIDESRLSYDGYSNTLPLAWPEVTGRDRAMNRRVDIIFTRKK